METTNNVTITLEEYRRLLFHEHDYYGIKELVENIGDRYLDEGSYKMLKLLCGIDIYKKGDSEK